MHHYKCASCGNDFNIFQPETCDECISALKHNVARLTQDLAWAREKIKLLEKQLDIAEVAYLETDEP